MKLLIDLFPVLVFFGVFRVAKGFPDASVALVSAGLGALDGVATQRLELAAVIIATLSSIAATAGQVGWMIYRRIPVKATVWLSAVLVVVFGGLTVWFHNEWFIKWKPTILYWIFAAVLVGGQWIWRRNLLSTLLTGELELPQFVWNRLLVAWASFFLFLGGANLFAAYSWSTDAWVNFKTFGLMGATLAFSLATGVYMSRYLDAEPDV